MIRSPKRYLSGSKQSGPAKSQSGKYNPDEQVRAFREAARELGADKFDERFKDTIRLAKPKPTIPIVRTKNSGETLRGIYLRFGGASSSGPSSVVANQLSARLAALKLPFTRMQPGTSLSESRE